MASLPHTPYKGARDWYPEDMRLREHIFGVWRRVTESFGYEPYDTPLLESIDVFAAKSGQELVTEQTYQFIDRGERRVVIRPEMTPSVSRMIAARQQEIPFPARWYSIAQFMRYERPQRGRDREFWQLNCDIFGADGVEAETEIIALGVELLRAFGASQEMYTIKVNNRKIINFMMAQYLELDAVQAQLMIKLFDRRSKIAPEAFRDQVIDILGPEAAKQGLQRIAQLLAAKTMADLPESIRDSEAVREIQELFTNLERLGIKNVSFDITLMRGLDYYTGTVFEFFDTHPENARALFGGGRYDGLVGLFGGEPVSAVGFAPGYSMMELFLRTHELLPASLETAKTDVYLAVAGDAQRGATKLAMDLRREGVNVELSVIDRSLDKKIKHAVRQHVPYLMVVGDDELISKQYALRNLASGEERTLSFERVVSAVRDYRRRERAKDDELDIDDI